MAVITQNQTVQSLLNVNRDTSSTAATTGSDELGKDAFLKLLVTQMKHQDPLNPLEGIEFTEQLAQFTSLEQLYQINDQFSDMAYAIQSQSNFQAISLVGKEVKAVGDEMSVVDGQATGGKVELAEAAASVVVTIYNDAGEKVRTIDLGQLAAGEHDVVWDGRNNSGGTVDDGTYTFQVGASSAAGENVDTITYQQGPVTGVSFDQYGVPTLKVNGLSVSIPNVVEIAADTSDTAGEA